MLFDEHVRLSARVAPFGGWDMPIQYRGIVEEHLHTRQAASVFDTCHMGEFMVCGADAAQALDRLVTCDVATLSVGRCRYGFLLNDAGGVLDDLIVYRLAQDEFMLVVNAGTTASDREWIKARVPADVTLDDVSEQIGKIDLQGPRSLDALQSHCNIDLRSLKYFGFSRANVLGTPAIISRTGYTGEYGFEVYIASDAVANLWRTLLADANVLPAGLGARDTLRLEMGLPLYGHELSTARTPAGAGLDFALAMHKEFIGAPAVAAELAAGPRERLVGLLLTGRQSARAEQALVYQGAPVGSVTSGSFAPSVGAAVALAYIATAHVAPGTAVHIDTGRKLLDARVVPLPFYTRGTARSGPR
jgi:aminomethyltransferase